MQHPLRRLTLKTPHLVNMRDLGGYACAGGVTRYGQVLRSNAPIGVLQEDIDFLYAQGLLDVIDLRSNGEIEAAPNSFLNHNSICVHTLFANVEHVSMAAMVASMSVAQDLGAFYIELAETYAEIFVRVLQLVANAKGTVLIHCHAGKDRTGVACALLLLCLGVAEMDVVGDYQLTDTYMKMVFKQFASPEIPAVILASNPASMEKLLAHLNENYGGATAYLQKHGLDGETLLRLKTKLVQTL